jgi:predicted esterase
VRVDEHRLVTARRARYYTVGGGETLSEVWIVLHGLGQLAAVFIKYFQSIVRPDRLVVAPEALNRHYIMPSDSGGTKDAKIGATWMTREDRASEIADYVDFLDAVWRETAANASRVTVLGFSQGVATAARWVSLGNSRIDRLVAWAGQLPPDVDPSVYGKLRDGVTLVTGTTDEYATWIAEGNDESRLVATGIKPQVVTFDGGHRMDRLTLDAIAGVDNPLRV